MSRRAAVLGLILAAGLALFLVLGRDASSPGPRPGAGGGESPGSGATPTAGLAAGGPTGLRRWAEPADRPPEHGTSTIVGTVRRGATAAAAHVDLRWVASDREYERDQRGVGVTVARAVSLRVAPAPMRSAEATADGRFTFDRLPAGVWEITATAVDGSRGSTRMRVAPEGVRVEVEIALVVGTETLDGRVLYEDGRPWEGIVLVAAHPVARYGEVSTSDASGIPVVLDAEGRFHAAGLPRGRAVVTALAAGSLRVAGMVIDIPYEGEYLLRIPLPGSVVGRVVVDADGAGIPGAEVLGVGMAGDQLALVSGRAVTDATGAFALALPGAGSIAVRAQGYAGAKRPYASSPVEIRLLRPARLEGRVTAAATGAGVPGLAVRLRPPGDREWAFPPDAATTGTDGRYAFEGLEPGETCVLASGPGWTTRGAAEVRVDGFNPFLVRLEPGKTASLDLVVEAGAAITGRVLDPEGRPVRGAIVRARRVTADFDSVLQRFESWGAPTASGPDGAFGYDSLVRGATYRVSAVAPGFLSAFLDAAAPEEGSVPPIELRLGAGHTLALTVLDDVVGTPIAGASVAFMVVHGDVTSPMEWITGSDGRALISPVGEAGTRLTVRADGYRGIGAFDVPVDRAETVVRLTPGLDIAGRVLAPDGTPAAGVHVRCIPPESEVTTRADGSFRVRGLSAGPHEILALASYPQRLTAAITVEAGRSDVILTLAAPAKDEPSPTLVVRVLDSQRAPVPGARVEFAWTSPSGGSSSSTAQEAIDGAARFERLGNRGEGTIRVSGAKARDGSALALGPATVEHVAADATEVVVTLPAGRSISGRVVGPNGVGVSGVPVHALSEQALSRGAGRRADRIPPGATSLGRTAADGTFRLDGLADETYALVCDVPPEFVRPEPLRVASGRTDVEISLKSGVVATIRVVDPTGAPVREANVGLYPVGSPGAGPLISMWTLENGSVRFPSLDPAAVYRLAVEVSSKRANLVAPPPVEPWSPHDDVVRLAAGGALRGVVLDSEGKPVAGAFVWWTQGDAADKPPGFLLAKDDGTFEIPHLAGGTIRLRADPPGGTPMGGASTAPTWTEASTGGDKVTLTIDLGLALDVVVENWPEENPIRAQQVQARLMDEAAGTGVGVAFANVSSSGRVQFRGLKAASKYTLWVGPVGDSSVLQRGLVAGRETRVQLVPGGSILVRLEGVPSSATWIGVQAEGAGVSVEGEKQGDGRYRIRGLPQGRWTVRAFAGGGDTPRLSAQAEAATGADVTLTLQPQSSPR